MGLGKRSAVLRNAHAPCKWARMRSIEIHACGSAQFTLAVSNGLLSNLSLAESIIKYSKTSAKTGKVSTVLADSVYRTYNDIKRDGWLVTRDSMSVRNFDRHIKMLTDCGLSRAALQNMTGLNDGAQIVPFVRFIEVNFCKQFPDWYEQSAPLHVRPLEQRTHLRLVA